MSEWKLLDLCIGKGKYGIAAPAVPRNNNLPTYLRITDINDDGTVNKGSLCSVEDENSKNYILKENDIVFARTGNSTGRSYFYNKNDGELVYAGFLIKFSLNPNIVNPVILKYYTHSKPYYDWIHSFDTGATRGNINAQTYANMPVVLPEKNVQDIIVHILSSLDAKIETNNKLNEKLEEMAQAIFKSWFVDFEPFKDKPFHETELGMIPEGWEVGSLSDIATITMGQSPCGTSYNENGEGIIFYQGRTEFGFRFPSIRLYTTAPSRFAEVGSTLMSVRAPVGDINMALLRCCIGRGVASIKSNCDCDSYIYYLMKSLKKRFDIYNGEGTVFGSVGRDTLRGLLITIPPSSVISDFEMNISKIDSRIKTNELESQRLASLRDTLLPRLMSGELIV